MNDRARQLVSFDKHIRLKFAFRNNISLLFQESAGTGNVCLDTLQTFLIPKMTFDYQYELSLHT
jgi:hypothetical protein